MKPSINPLTNKDIMGRMKEVFAEQQYLNQAVDSLMDEDYHYKQWEREQYYDGWVPERDGLTLEDIENETNEEKNNNDNINLNKG